MSFDVDLTRFVSKLGKRADSLIKKVAFAGVQGVMTRTPVDTGRARASWRVKFNQESRSVASKGTSTGKKFKDPTGAKEMNDTGINRVLLARNINKDIVISNALPYAVPLENGLSKQGSGMVKKTAKELKKLVETGKIKA